MCVKAYEYCFKFHIFLGSIHYFILKICGLYHIFFVLSNIQKYEKIMQIKHDIYTAPYLLLETVSCFSLQVEIKQYNKIHTDSDYQMNCFAGLMRFIIPLPSVLINVQRPLH